MAEDSNFDKKPGKKASGSGSDFKPPHKKSKDFQTYFEPKGNAPSGNQEDQAAQKGNRNDAQGSGKPKSYAKNRKESRDHPPNVWKKKHPKVSKDYILEFYAKAPLSKEIDDLVSTTENLFVNEKLVPVNQENFSLDPNEGLIPKTAFQPSTNSSSNTTASSLTNLPGPGGSATTSTNPPTTSNLPTPSNPPGTSEAPVEPSQTSTTAPSNVQATSSNVSQTTPKPWETSSSDPTQLTPIQIMREKMRRKNPLPKPDEAKRKELEGIEKKKAETEKNVPTESAQAAKPQEQVKNEDSNYSNIDEMYENRLKNEKAQEKNSTENNLQEDNQIPEWDSVDANKAVQEIRKEEFLASLPQDKKTIFGDKYVEKKEDKNASQQVRNQAGGVDFSQVSFDNETKARMNDNYDLSAEELYNQQMGRGNPYSGANVHGGSQENINLSNLNYNPQDPSQNMYRVVPGQSMQQGVSLYGNKNFAANQATTPTATTPKQNTPPSIIFKYFSPNYESKDWYYIDLEEKLQGPYSGRTMDEWFVKGYLPLNLHVTIGQSSQFKKLKDLADIISNHNAQSEAQPKQAVQKTPSSTSIQDQQYLQQYQNQQQQYQQQYPQQYQQQQQYQSQQQQYQQQQQPYYKQGSQGGVHELQRFHSDTPSYGTNFQSGSNRNDSYYAQQGASGQFGGHGSHDFVRSASATDFQSQNHYQNYGGNWQDNQQKVIQNYPNYKANQGGSGSNAYYQQETGAYQAGFTQTGYNQAQKNPQWKGTQQASAYPSQGNFGNQGSNFAAQNPGSFSYGNVQGGQNNMMYPAQQQQNFNRSNSMGGGSLGNANMSGYQM